MKRIVFSLMASVLLSSCVSVPPPLTDEQISSMDGAQLCAVSQMRVDPRLDGAIKEKKVDCSPSSLYCEGQGMKKGTKKFNSCVSKWKAEYAIQQKRMANPAWAFCVDNGFKTGTQGMATCIASWEQRHQQQRMMAIQQQQYEQAQRAQAWRDLGNQLLLQDQIRQQQLRNSMPKTTNCNVWRNNMNCTTW